ncbi:hypothetical protein KC915_24970 [Enterobacter hormaechei]|uniref:hypothetical protein n=1 Tax=Enterobacter hormaechei TaxID=158836 RepID=UPI0033151FAF
MTILLWIVGGLAAWWLFGFCWLRLFVGDETDKDYEECPSDQTLSLRVFYSPANRYSGHSNLSWPL